MGILSMPWTRYALEYCSQSGSYCTVLYEYYLDINPVIPIGQKGIWALTKN